MKSKLRAVSNTSFITVMHNIGYLNLCNQVFERIYLPRSVYQEVKQSDIRPLIARLEEAVRNEMIVIKECSNTALVNSLKSFLGSGEAETIALALELKDVEVVILDDLKARNLCRRLNIGKRLTGTIGVLKFMLTHGVIKENADTIITRLEQAGFHFKKELFKNC